MKILITGGSGFIGSHVIDQLEKKGYEIVNFDVSVPKYKSSAKFIKGDILSIEQITQATEDIDLVYHLAAEADVNRMLKTPAFAIRLNVNGTINVLEAARKNNFRVLFASTDWVYGGCEEAVVDETTKLYPPKNNHTYTTSKIAAEMFIQNYDDLYGVNYTIMRFGIPFGPRARPSTVTHIFLNRALNDEPIKIHGKGDQFRQFIYVEDLTEGCAACIDDNAENQIFNLNGKEKVTIRQIVDTIKLVLNKEVQIDHIQAREGDFKGREVRIDKAKRLIGWEPKHSYKEAMTKYIGWFKEHIVPNL